MVSRNEGERTPLLAQQSKVSNLGMRASDRHNDDDLDFDARFRKWKAAVARKFRLKADREAKPTLLITHFDGLGGAQPVLDAKRASIDRESTHEATAMTSSEFQQQVEQVKSAIARGVYPKMITTGSSGSYFVRIISDSSQDHADLTETSTSNLPQQARVTTVAVFKPKDEEPYGNLNPKRQFLRKYLWWAMGRPCLIPNFSYLSEVGASYLDSRLALQMVPRTELVELASPTFHYAFSDRKALEKDHIPLPNKIGSYQTFLNGYANASDFLRKHPWPSRTRSKTLLIRDMDDESRAHKVSRKKERARLRNCGVAIKRALLCRPSIEDFHADDEPDSFQPTVTSQIQRTAGEGSHSPPQDGFYWTPKRMEQFRLQLERLVALDFLMRNTDRGLDNFMIRHDADKDEIKIGAIDNSLSFPIKHPNEIRQYPFGWLFLPSDLIGLPFSDETRDHLLPILDDPAWWQHTVLGLRKIFQQDPYFDEAKFERQMSVMRGQGWNLVQSLQAPDEGPLDLCAREKKLIRQEVHELPIDKIDKMDGVKVALDSDGHVLPPSATPGSAYPTSAAAGKPPISRTISSGVLEVERRPIGMRASESYRKALLRAAGTDAPSDADDQFLSDDLSATGDGMSSSLPHTTSTLKDQKQSDVFSEDTQPEPNGTRAAQKHRHHRIASAHDVGTLPHRRRRSSRVDNRGDGILGRTGIEVLEGLDRERKQNNKLSFFRHRPRSSTVSNDTASQHVQQYRPAPRARQSSSDAGRVEGERSWDLSSSIVSDPGTRFDGTARWRKSRSSSRPSDGMTESLYDLHRQGEVLSEEEEEDGKEDVGQGSSGDTARSSRGAVATIESVLAAHEEATHGPSKSRDDDRDEADRPNQPAFVPHIPHPTSIGPARNDSYQSRDTELTSASASSSKRTVKVIVEKISSDTKQAWLKWI